VRHRIAPKVLGAMKERVRQLTWRTCGRSLIQSVGELRGYLVGWKAYFRLAETPGVFQYLDEWLRRRLRAVQLKHWKRGPVVYRELRARGLSDARARQVAANARRWWRNSDKAIHIAIPNSFFDQLGLPRLAA
jgi:hypothetical protein